MKGWTKAWAVSVRQGGEVRREEGKGEESEVHVTGRLTYKWPSSVIVHFPSPSISEVLDVNDQDKSKTQRCNGDILRVYLS